ncbi:MAG TPA: response regulator [Bryobacteraceae bacterium]|jgi:DNA-binding response OmpR family regulator|nr:response regulator [Bryobacteraceae bacterium]
MNGDARILLVEDDPQDVELTLRAFRTEKVQSRIEIVRDGEEALDYLFRRGDYKDRPVDEPPTLVLLDLKLPKIDGLQVLREVKTSAECRSIPVIVLTSSGEQRDIAESYKLGVNSYIQKPVDIAEFRKAIRALALYWLDVNRPPFSRKAGTFPPAAPPLKPQ